MSTQLRAGFATVVIGLLSTFLLTGLPRLLLAQDQDPVFSGPQAGEPLVAFTMETLLERDAVKKIDPIEQADGKPVILIFVHEITRPSIGLTRVITEYAERWKTKNLEGAVIFLSDDPTETRGWAQRARQAIPQQFPVGISTDGLEGPGAYGLNRNVMMTILVGKENKVTANFALVQPSIQADGYKIVKALAAALDVEPPTEEGFLAAQPQMRRDDNANARLDAEYRTLMRPIIQKDADESAIDAAAKKLEEAAEKNPALKKRVADAARRIIEADKLDMYGNAFGQAYLKKWAETWK